MSAITVTTNAIHISVTLYIATVLTNFLPPLVQPQRHRGTEKASSRSQSRESQRLILHFHEYRRKAYSEDDRHAQR